MSRIRHEYVLLLSEVPPDRSHDTGPAGSLRPVSSRDQAALAELMLDAFLGTVNYDGETFEEAAEELRRFFASGPDLECSVAVIREERLAAACLVAPAPDPACPLVWYVMTAAKYKGQGRGSLALSQTLGALARRGESEVRAIITEGNLPSERLFARAGFRQS